MILRPQDEPTRAEIRARQLRAVKATRPCRWCRQRIKTKGGLVLHEQACGAKLAPLFQYPVESSLSQ